MNAVSKIAAVEERDPLNGLDLLRSPFPEHQIGKLPKETGAQAKQRKTDQDAGRWPNKCAVCGGYHHPNAVHLDYVGHAAVTLRLLDCDPEWSWEPAAFTAEGLPAFDRIGGLWIKLTVCGVTRLGYGSAGEKQGGDAVKEIIGDALRNAALRFGAALDLWHKGDLHGALEEPEAVTAAEKAINLLKGCGNGEMFWDAWVKNKDAWLKLMSEDDFKTVVAVKNDLVEHWKAEKARAETEAKATAERSAAATTKSAIDAIGSDEIPF